MTRQVSRLSGGRLPLPVGETVLTCGLSVAAKVKQGFVRAWRGWCQDVVVTEPETYPAELHRV